MSLGVAALVASASALAAAESDFRRIDQDLRTLKAEAVRLNRSVDALERASLYGDGSAVTAYLSVRASGFLVERFSVRINDQAPVAMEYASTDAIALLTRNAWQRLDRRSLPPGTHRLEAEFSGRFFDAGGRQPPMRGRLEILFEKRDSELALVLPLTLDAESGTARRVQLVSPERLDPALGGRAGSLEDPRFRSALHLKAAGRYLSALEELTGIAGAVGDPSGLPAEFHRLVADSYLGFGLEAHAEELYGRIASAGGNAAGVAEAQLQLAKFDYQRGYHTQAAARLRELRGRVPEALGDDWRSAYANALLAEERYGDAAELLGSAAARGDLAAFSRFNLAVALLLGGRVAEGLAELDRVGTMAAETPRLKLLRDKANLTLGYQHLQAQHGLLASEAFLRVRPDAAFSNRALLGLGWAQISAPGPEPVREAEPPPGSQDWKDFPGIAGRYPTLKPQGVEKRAGAGKEAPKQGIPAAAAPPDLGPEALRRALGPWQDLAKGDPMDPAVQEGRLAVAWALDQLKDYEQSLARYQEAIGVLETARQRMDAALAAIRSGRMVETIVHQDVGSERGRTWRLRDLPDVPETYFLQRLLAEHSFQESLKNYLDARLLLRNLDALEGRLGAIEQADAAARETVQAPEERPEDVAGADAPAPAEDAAGQQRERVELLRRAIGELRPRLAAAEAAQGRLLEAAGARELEGQKRIIEQYLTEARFAVTQIFERQLKGAQ